MRRLCGGLAIALCVSGAAASDAQDDPRAAAWLGAAGDHTAGAIDAPVATVSTWPRRQALDTVTRALGSPDTARLIKGLALHTDAAILEHARAEGRPGVARAGSAVLLDGEVVGSSPRSLQWEIGRLIANALARRAAKVTDAGVIPDGIGPARAWYHASSALLQQWADCGTLRQHLDDGLKAFPADATLLLYRATLHQTFADPRVQVWISEAAAVKNRIQRPPQRPRENDDDVALSTEDPQPEPTGPSRSEIMQVGKPSNELALAERDLRAALASDPALVEARLRLAHVLSALGRKAEAADLARLPPGTPLPPFLDYYGAMVLGRAEADLGRHAEARAAFERAARLLPLSQSPRVALSRLAMVDGHSGDAVAMLTATSGPDVKGDVVDPWWSYFRLHAPDAKALLTTFRERAR